MNTFMLVLIIIVIVQSVFMALLLTRKTKSEDQIKEEIKIKEIKITKEQIKEAVKNAKKKRVNPFNILGGGV